MLLRVEELLQTGAYLHNWGHYVLLALTEHLRISVALFPLNYKIKITFYSIPLKLYVLFFFFFLLWDRKGIDKIFRKGGIRNSFCSFFVMWVIVEGGIERNLGKLI
jgi:hypothetical protein